MIGIVRCAAGIRRSDVVTEAGESIDAQPRKRNEDCGRQVSKSYSSTHSFTDSKKDERRRTQYFLLSAEKDRGAKNYHEESCPVQGVFVLFMLEAAWP